MKVMTKKTVITTWFCMALVSIILNVNAAAEEGQLTHFQLSNGLDLFVKEDHSRKVAALEIWVMVGST